MSAPPHSPGRRSLTHPLLARPACQRARRDEDVVVVQSPGLTVHEPRTKVDLTRYTECHSFTFDEVLDEDASNDQVYASAVEPLISVVFQRGRATCFAYGQTGSGKTHTMQPLPVRAARQILDTVASSAAMATLRLGVSFFEVRCGWVGEGPASSVCGH